MTRVLLNRLEEASVPSSITSCVDELNTHLIQHPACKAVVWQVYNTRLKSIKTKYRTLYKCRNSDFSINFFDEIQEKAALRLLRRRRIFWMDEKLQEAIRETLALIGYVDPVKGCGVRVLSIDGGGTK